MYIIRFVVLMILSQNILPPTEAKPYFTKIHRLNSVRDFDDVVDWTQNVQKQEPKGSQEAVDYPAIKERSVSSEAPEIRSQRSDVTTKVEERGTSERMTASEMPSPPSKEEPKDEKKRSEVEELKDVVDENEDNTEEFGEGISNLYKRMRDKMKKKKCKTCLDEEAPIKLEDLEDDYRSNVKYILPYRRSAPVCLLNERCNGEYFRPAAAVPAVQPVYFQGSPNDERSGLYEVQWLEHSPVSSSFFRKRREIDRLYPGRTYSFMVDRACDHNEMVSEAQKELMCMIRAVKNEFLNKNNLTFLPILFVPHCENGKQPCPDMSGCPELGQLTFQNVENDQCKMPEREKEPGCPQKETQCVPTHGKINNSSCMNIGHMTIILLVNNTLSVVFPDPNHEPRMPPQECPEQPTICLQQPPPPQQPQPPPLCCCPCADQSYPYKRNVIDNLKSYLENAFNFIDIRRVLTEDEVHDRNSRDAFKKFGGNVIPGILLYPKRYGATLTKCCRDTKNPNVENAGSPMDYYYFTTNNKGGPKFKRSLDAKKSSLTEGDIAAEGAQLEIEKKQAQLEKEMQKDLNLDKEVVEALNVGSSTSYVSPSDQMKKDEAYLEKENQEMIHNEQLLEGPDLVEPTEHTCVFTEPLIAEVIEPISAATDTAIETAAAAASAAAESAGNIDEVKAPEPEELEEVSDTLTEPPEDPCPPPCDSPCPCPCPCEEPCPPPCKTDEGVAKQSDLAKESKSKMTKSIAEFEDEMRGIISHSKKQSLANEEKRKGVFDVTTKPAGKLRKKRKLKRLRRCQRPRRDLRTTKASSSGWKEVTTTSKMAARDVERETTELVKVTRKESTSLVALCEEVEDVTEVLFTTKPNQEQLEMECNAVKGGQRSAKTTTQKLGQPVTIVITRSTEAASTSTEAPSVLSEYLQPPLRDENDEAVTETLNRLLRDLRLVDQVQNILEGIKETGYEIREAIKRRTKRTSPSDVGGFSTSRKLFSMEVHQKADETKAPLKSFRKRTYRRRSGGGFKRYTRTISENKGSSPEDLNEMLEDGLDSKPASYNKESTSSKRKRRRKDYVFKSEDTKRSSRDVQEEGGKQYQDFDKGKMYDQIHKKRANEGEKIELDHIQQLTPSGREESEFLLYDCLKGAAEDSRKKRSFIDSNNDLKDSMDEYEYSGEPQLIKKRADVIPTSKDDAELLEISNALEEMVNKKYEVYIPKIPQISTEEESLDELITSIPDITMTEPPITPVSESIEEEFSDILDIEKSLDTTLPPLTETTTASYLLTQIPEISWERFEVVTTLEDLLASAPLETPNSSTETETEESSEDEEFGKGTNIIAICGKHKKIEIMPSFKTWDQVMYPLELQTIQPKEKEGDLEESTSEGNNPCEATTKAVKILIDEKEIDPEYYIDIVIPYDTDEQQEYIDRFVKREEPPDADFIDHPKRKQRDDRSLSKTLKEIEVLGEGRETSSESEQPPRNPSEEREIWKEFKWPEHKRYEGSLTSTEKQIESLSEGEDEERQIWKEFKWPEHRKYDSSTVKKIGGDSGDRQISNEFKWPEHRKYDVVGSLTSTEKEIEVLTNGLDEDNLEGFSWPEHNKYKSYGGKTPTSTPKKNSGESRWPNYDSTGRTMLFSNWGTQSTVKGTNGVWQRFKWPEHRNYGTATTSFPSKNVGSVRSTSSLFGTELPSRNGVEEYESEMGNAEKPPLAEWPARPKIPAKFEEVKTEQSSEWNEFNSPSPKLNHWASKEYADLPAKHKVTESIKFFPMEEGEKLGKLDAEALEEFDWSAGSTSYDRETARPHVMKTALWEKLHLPFHDTAHLKVVPATTFTKERLDRGTTEEIGIWNKFRWPEHKKYTSQVRVTENLPMIETVIWNEIALPHKGDSTPSQVTGIWQKFNWPEHKEYPGGGKTKAPPITGTIFWDRLHLPMHLKMVNNSEESKPQLWEELFIATTRSTEVESVKTTRKAEETKTEGEERKRTTKIIENSFNPEQLTSKTYILEGTETKTTTDIWEALQWPPPKGVTPVLGDQLEAPVESFDLFAFPSSSMETNQTNTTLLDVPVPPFPPLDEYDEYSLFSTPSEMGLLSELSVPSGTLDKFTPESEQKPPFWDHLKKKVHHRKTSTTEGFPTKQTSPPTKSTTIGERLELAEEIDIKKHHGAHTEPTLHGPIKIAQERTFHTPVRESEDDENLWDFRVLSEEEVVTFHPKTRKPTQKKTTIYSFKPIGTTADDWEVFNEPPKEEVTQPLSKSSVSEEAKTTFYVVIPQPTETFENVEETEKTLMLEPPPPIAPPGAVEASTEYYDEEMEEVTLEDYEDMLVTNQVEATNLTYHENEELSKTEEVEEFETVTFRVTQIFVDLEEARSSPKAEPEENVEQVTFRTFESYPTKGEESFGKIMENLKEHNHKEGLIDSLELEMVTFRKPSVEEIKTSPPITLPQMDIWKGDEDNLLYALTETSNASLDLSDEAMSTIVSVLVGVGEGTTRIIEGDKVITEPYDHRSMSIPFNEKLEGASDISKEINKPDDSDEFPPVPPMSDLAADFMREQSDLGWIRDPYERELTKIDVNLKSSNLEEDLATALMEPDRLGVADEDSRKKSKHLLESLERPSVLEELKKKLSHLRAKPITAGGNENGAMRGKQYMVGGTTISDLLEVNFTYPEAVEAVIAVEKTEAPGKDHPVEGGTKRTENIFESAITYPEAVGNLSSPFFELLSVSTEPFKFTINRANDKFKDLIDSEDQLERSEVTEVPFREATTIPDLLTAFADITRRLGTSPFSSEPTSAETYKKGFSTINRPNGKFEDLIDFQGQLERSELTEAPIEETTKILSLLTAFADITHRVGTTGGKKEQSTSERTSPIKADEIKSSGIPSENTPLDELLTALHVSASEIPLSSVELPVELEEIIKSESAIEAVSAISSKTSIIAEETTLGEIERILELQGDLKKPGSTGPVVKEKAPTPSEEFKEILETLDEFEIPPESYITDSVPGEPRGHGGLESEIGEEVTHEPKRTIPNLLTPLLMIGEEHMTKRTSFYVPPSTSPIASQEFSGVYEMSTVQPSTTILGKEELSLITPLSIPKYVTIQPSLPREKTTDKHTKTKIENIQQKVPVKEDEQEIEINLAHLPQAKHETSTICEICSETEGSKVWSSTVKTSIKYEFKGGNAEEIVSPPLHTFAVHTTKRSTTLVEVEDFDANLLHMPEKTHETSTLCEICDGEKFQHSSGKPMNVAGPPGTTQKLEETLEEKKHGYFSSTPQTISHKEELQDQEFENNLHHLPEEHKHETSTICEICNEEEAGTIHTTFFEAVMTTKSHHVPELKSKSNLETSSELTHEEKLEQEEFQSNLHHLPEHHVHETSTICEICNEEEAGTIHTTFFEEGMTTKSHHVPELKSKTILETSSELTHEEKFEQEEFQSNLHHLPEHHVHETSTICEICIDEESKEPSFSKIPSTSSPGHEFKSSQSPGESGKGFGFSKKVPEEELFPSTEIPYNFEGREIEQPMHTTNRNVFKIGRYTSTTNEGVSGGTSIKFSTKVQGQEESSEVIIEKIETTESISETSGSALEGPTFTAHFESTIEEGLEAAKNIEEKLEEIIKTQKPTVTERVKGTEAGESTKEEYNTLTSLTLISEEKVPKMTSEIPRETNFYTEFKPTPRSGISTMRYETTLKGSTPTPLKNTTQGIVQVLQELEKMEEESKNRTEGVPEITTHGEPLSSGAQMVEHTKVEDEEHGIEDMEERGTTHIDTGVSALLKNLEDIQEEIFFSSLRVVESTEPGRTSEKSKIIEPEEGKTTSTIEKVTQAGAEAIETEHHKKITGTAEESILFGSVSSSIPHEIFSTATMEELKKSEAIEAGIEETKPPISPEKTTVYIEHITSEKVVEESEKTEKTEGTTVKSNQLELLSTSTHIKSEEEGLTDFYTEISSQSTPLEKPGEHITAISASSETHISEGSTKAELTFSETFLSQNIEKKLEELNEVVDELLMSSTEPNLIIEETGNVEKQITENFLLEEELEELNKEFVEMLKTTISAEGLLEGLEHSSHAVIKGTQEEFGMSTDEGIGREQTEYSTHEFHEKMSSSSLLSPSRISGEEDTKHETTQLYPKSSPSEEIILGGGTSGSLHSTEGYDKTSEEGEEEIKTNFYTEENLKSTPGLPHGTEKIEEPFSQAFSYTHEEPTVPTSKEALVEGLEGLGHQFSKMLETTLESTEQGKIGTVQGEESTPSSALKPETEGHLEKIDEKLNELKEVVGEILNASLPPPEHPEGVGEEITESQILEKELEELKKEFEEILRTTLSAEEILENPEDTSSTSPIVEVHTKLSVEEPGLQTALSAAYYTATSNLPYMEMEGSTTLSLEEKTRSEIATSLTAVITEEVQGPTNFYTDFVIQTQSKELSPSIPGGTERSTHISTEGVLITEGSTIETSMFSTRPVTDKLEQKLEELDEIINEFLSSTPFPEIIVESTGGKEEENTEEEVLEKELEDLKHEFQLMLSTTIAPDDLLVAVEEVLSPTKSEEEATMNLSLVSVYSEELSTFLPPKKEGTEEIGHSSEVTVGGMEKSSFMGPAELETTVNPEEIHLHSTTRKGEFHEETHVEGMETEHSTGSEVDEGISEGGFTVAAFHSTGVEAEGHKESESETTLHIEGKSDTQLVLTEAATSPEFKTEAHGVTVEGLSGVATSETELQKESSSKFGIESEASKPSSRQTERNGPIPETSTSKMHIIEGLSSVSLLTTLLLALVTSTTQTPNVSGPQNIPKCLVVFITGESPLLPLNGTKWVPSECPRLGEESTTPHPSGIVTPSQGTTEISTSSESKTTSSIETTEIITTTLVPVEELPEIKSNNFVEDGCTEADFENNNKCFCMLDVTVDHVAEDLEGSNSSKTNIKCSKFLKVNKGLVMRNETSSTFKRSRRSYLYLRYLNRQRRETVEYNKIDEVLANELTATNTDTTIYTAVGATATVPCVYKDEVVEREHFMKYIWTANSDKTIIFSDRVREATDGALKISEVTVEDDGNYTCSINRPFGNTDSERKKFLHELLVIDRPIFKVRSTVMYETDEPCSLKDGDVVHAYLPKTLEELLCGIHKRVCKIEMERPSCVEVEEKTYLTVKYIVTLDGISTLLPSISSTDCDFNCQMKVMGSLVSLLIKNVETTSVLDVISEMQSFNHTFKPREVRFPTDRSAVEDPTLLPKLVIGCPTGFGIQRSTAKICVACPRNTYNSENSSICSPCPKVYYQPRIGSSSCIECKTPFDDKACLGMMFANKAFMILYVGSSVAIVFFLLLCIFCAQNSAQAAFGGPQRKKRAQTPKRRRIGRKDVEDPAEKPLLPKDPSVPKIVKGPKVPPPDF